MTLTTQLKNGKDTLLGSFLSEIAHPNLVRIAKAAGMDFLIIDSEHGYFDYPQVAALAGMGSASGLPCLVRIPQVERECIQKYLDAGVNGLVAPMVSDVSTARELVRLAKYAPLGERGISTMRPHSEYNPGSLEDYLPRANASTLLLVQIETAQGVESCEEIAQVEGIDVVLVGPNDLACSFGTPGRLDTPEMQRALRRVIKAAADAGKQSGIISSSQPFLKECRRMGMRILSCNSETGLLHAGMKALVNSFLEE